MGSRIGVIESEPLALDGIRAALGSVEDLELGAAWEQLAAAETELSSDPSLQLLAEMTALGRDPLGAIARLTAAGHCIVVRATRVDLELAHVLIDVGAYGIVSRAAAGAETMDALRAARRRERYAPPEIRAGLERRWIAGERSLLTVLTPREREVLTLMGGGLSAQAISIALYIALPTVRTHLRQAYMKLGVNSNAAAMGELSRLGLMSPTRANHYTDDEISPDRRERLAPA